MITLLPATMESIPVLPHTPPSLRRTRHLSQQQGVTLLELMVGLAIGLLVVATAMGALMLSRGISGTVNDASSIQQQGAHTLRVIGQQLRQAGSLYLNPDPRNSASNDPLSAVVFEIKAIAHDGGNSFDQTDAISGTADSLTTGFRRYADRIFLTTNTDSLDVLARNCVGAPAYEKNGTINADERVESIFAFDSTKNSLQCSGNGVTTAQPIAQNVAQFQVSYLVQTNADGSVQYVKGGDMPTSSTDPKWRSVQGVQVCLVLYGSELIDMPSGSSYTDCDGKAVDITTLTDTKRKNRMHLLFRNTFQLRSQGLI
ncbi:PilW family protein [Comamonas testosteroni]|uniref:PilW family protein n=1 Tax=Comamonas testosteroni TaxID=285 RepID=UPI0023AB2D3A|nr:PilW family protein [Comamonas testosteroni]WEE78957.1 PilW family protein [Comamonas testosteroni]